MLRRKTCTPTSGAFVLAEDSAPGTLRTQIGESGMKSSIRLHPECAIPASLSNWVPGPTYPHRMSEWTASATRARECLRASTSSGGFVEDGKRGNIEIDREERDSSKPNHLRRSDLAKAYLQTLAEGAGQDVAQAMLEGTTKTGYSAPTGKNAEQRRDFLAISDVSPFSFPVNICYTCKHI